MRLKKYILSILLAVTVIASVYFAICFGFTLNKSLTQPCLQIGADKYNFIGYYLTAFAYGGAFAVSAFVAILILKFIYNKKCYKS